MSDNIDTRSKLLLGDKFKKLSSFKICVIGLGGVGSIIPISLVRSGVKHLLIIDKDKVEESNLNRQIGYDLDDIGRYKTEALFEKISKIRKEIDVKTRVLDITKGTDLSFLKGYDYVCDCIDDIYAKVEIIKYCVVNNINIISSLGMGNRLDPTSVYITKLNRTTTDPFARKLRYLLRKENVDTSNVEVSFSSENPIINKTIVSSMIFTPNASGLAIASYVLQKLINKEGNVWD